MQTKRSARLVVQVNPSIAEAIDEQIPCRSTIDDN